MKSRISFAILSLLFVEGTYSVHLDESVKMNPDELVQTTLTTLNSYPPSSI